MTKLVDLSQVRSAWAHRYGSARATAMLAGSRGPVAAYDSAVRPPSLRPRRKRHGARRQRHGWRRKWRRRR